MKLHGTSPNYPLIPFRITDITLTKRIICEYPLATIISARRRGHYMSLIPLLIDQSSTPVNITLFGHIDKNNPHSLQICPGLPISFVFQGPNVYASPDLYEDRQLPGWLYVCVKGAGLVGDPLTPESARSVLRSASREFGDDCQRFALDTTDDRIDRFIHGNVSFSIDVKEVSTIAKLAQDKGQKHASIAVDKLSARESAEGRQILLDLVSASHDAGP